MAHEFNLGTRKGVIGALLSLRLPEPDPSVLPILSAMERSKLTGALNAVLDAPNPSVCEREMAYLKSLTFSCSIDSVQAMTRMGFDYEPKQLVLIGRSHVHGRLYRCAFDAALNGDQNARRSILGVLSAVREENAETGGDPAAANAEYTQRQPASDSPAREYPEEISQPPYNMPEATPANKDFGPSYHVYGGKGAICFAVKKPSQERPEWGIHIEAASSTAPRIYDWSGKINIRFNPAEMPMFLGVLLGFKRSFEGSSHGPKNDKSFSIENQGGKFFVKVSSTGRSVPVPMTLGDAWWVAALIFTTLAKACGLTEDSVIRLVKTMCDQERNATTNSAARAA